MKRIRVLSVFGTRPEAIKMCPLIMELKRRERIESLVCLTGQHREMLDSVMEFYGQRADYDLDIMAKNQTITDITVRTLTGLETVLEECSPDLVLVHGDTTTSFAGALAAFYKKIPVGHVEAGLRTHDKYSPYPEEMNRRLTGAIAELHFCPTRRNAANLAAEGVNTGVFITGNTVIDAVRHTVDCCREFRTPELRELDFAGRRVILMTCHRRENYGEPMESIMRAVRRITQDFEDVELVYPVHLSPVVQECAHRNLDGLDRVHLVPPLDTDEMDLMMSRCYMVMTDSGGIQEEAPSLGKPVLVMRRETERPEAVEAGTVRLAGVSEKDIYDMAAELLCDETAYERMARAVNPYGDGLASGRIADAIEWHFGLGTDRPQNFGE